MKKAFYSKRKMILAVSEAIGVNQRDAKRAIEAVFSEVVRALVSGEHCELRNFGTFEVVRRKGRHAHNPKFPDRKCEVPDHNGVRFRPSPVIVAAVAGVQVPK